MGQQSGKVRLGIAALLGALAFALGLLVIRAPAARAQSNESVLYSFGSQGGTDCTDGAVPLAGLIQGSDGNFYGTTRVGGNTNDAGTVFKLTPSGILTTLYSFCSQGGTDCTDGEYPYGGLIQGSDGNFYGTTFEGGDGYFNVGTVFKITPSGTLTTLYSFCSQANCTDGELPYAGLIQGSDGNFYGTTG
ncbi:MAG: choice-of-anchor tandem repeat GloVer-containing protein, partial [Candidatus Acidiferrales bacterium]